MKPRRKRLILVAAGLGGVAIAAALVMNAMKDNMVFFFSPSDVLIANKAPQGKTFRLGGLVETGSVQRGDGLAVRFTVTDTVKAVPVTYSGILPDLFREGQGVIAQGKLGPDGVFHAEEVLAKHDETYMPPEVAKSLEEAQKTKAVTATTAEGGTNP